MRIAAIDIGSNSIKLLVAEPGPAGTLTVLRREKEMVRLGHETLLTGHLSSEAIVRAIRTLSVFKSVSQSCGAEQILAIATASVREADNAEQFIAEVQNRTGIRVDVLSGVEEARLIGLAAEREAITRASGRASQTALFSPRNGLLNIDIGGGSTELSLMKSGRARALHSVKIGAVRLSEQFLLTDPPKRKELENLTLEIDASLERPIREMRALKESRGVSWELTTGTSGTILSLATALSGTQAQNGTGTTDKRAAPPERLQPIERKDLKKLAAQLAALPQAERKKLPGINEQRAEIIVAGAMILERTMKALRVSSLVPCEWSLREGVILDRLYEFGELPSARHLAGSSRDPRLLGAEALGNRFGFEEAHGRHVAMLAGKLFDQLRGLHGVEDHQKVLLEAAAILHDIGYAVSHESHHKHSLYLIRNSELTGFTDRERLIIANVARYHRKAMPKEEHAEFAELSEADRQLVWKLGGMLRVADALDRSHASRVRNVQCAVRRGKVVMEIGSPRRTDHERWAVERKKNMFEAVFQRPLVIAND